MRPPMSLSVLPFFMLISAVCYAQQSEGILVKEGQTMTVQSSEADQNFRPGHGVEDDPELIKLGYRPHPYIDFGVSDMPGGYAPLAAFGRAGLEIESRHLILGVSGAYDNGHKVNDNDQPNPKGHDRYLRGTASWRLSTFSLPKWFVSAGYRWSQLSTTNYSKGGARPQFGGGYEYSGSPSDCSICWMSARIGVEWVMAGTDWQNGSHGLDITVIMPRPTEKGHFFITSDLGIYRFHTTVTEPTDQPLTLEQRGERHFSGTYSAGLRYRFW